MVASLLRLPPILISRRALLGLMAALAAAGCLVCSATTQADEAPFYRGKTLSVQIGFSAGGYDLYGYGTTAQPGPLGHFPDEADRGPWTTAPKTGG